MKGEGDPEQCLGEPSPLHPIRGHGENQDTDASQKLRGVRTEVGRAEGAGKHLAGQEVRSGRLGTEGTRLQRLGRRWAGRGGETPPL